MLEKKDVKYKNILSLAYYGDAVYESLVREFLMEHTDNMPVAAEPRRGAEAGQAPDAQRPEGVRVHRAGCGHRHVHIPR